MVSDMPVRVLVCGGRGYSDARKVRTVLQEYRIAELCQGGAAGADALALCYAETVNVPCRTYKADWSQPCTRQCYHPPKQRYGKRYCPLAGLRRNELMLADFGPDLVVAFPGGSGTAHMVKIAVAAGVHVVEVAP